MSRVLVRPYLARLIGEAPSPDPDVVGILCPHTTSGRRLASVLPGDYEEEYSRENLIQFRVWCHRWRAWHRNRARAAAVRLLDDLHFDGEKLLLLGQQVAEAFGLKYRPLYSEAIVGPRGIMTYAYVIPHPSGKNRWWNDWRNVQRCREFLHEVVHYGKKPLKVSGGPCR